MTKMDYTMVTALEKNDLISRGNEIVSEIYPEFMMHDEIANVWFHQLYEKFPEYQYWLWDKGKIVGIGNSIPLHWDDNLKNLPEEGWDWAIVKGFKDKEKNIKPNLLCALSITVNPEYQRKGVSSEMTKTMVQIGKKNNLDFLIIPVRPTLKKDYPLIEMDKYILWKRKDAKLFDPWLRVHKKLGGKIIKVCAKAMKISGTISDWEKWTGMKFPGDGEYIIKGALNPVKFIKGKGNYIEPNVWVKHNFRVKNL